MMSFAYLASPYSHPDPAERELRYVAALKKTAELMLAGEKVFSPIVHTHHLERLVGAQRHGWWLDQYFPVLAHAAKLLVLRLDGWGSSFGVAQEIRFAEQHNIPVEYVDP